LNSECGSLKEKGIAFLFFPAVHRRRRPFLAILKAKSVEKINSQVLIFSTVKFVYFLSG